MSDPIEETKLEKIYKKIDLLKKEATDDCYFNRQEMESQFNIAFLKMKWINYRLEWGKTLRILEEKRKQLFRKLYEYYRLESKLKLTTKEEINLFIESDPQYTEIFSLCQTTKEVEKYCLDTVENLKTKSYQVKEFIAWQNFINGR
jgi:hypothetical protein